MMVKLNKHMKAIECKTIIGVCAILIVGAAALTLAENVNKENMKCRTRGGFTASCDIRRVRGVGVCVGSCTDVTFLPDCGDCMFEERSSCYYYDPGFSSTKTVTTGACRTNAMGHCVCPEPLGTPTASNVTDCRCTP